METQQEKEESEKLLVSDGSSSEEQSTDELAMRLVGAEMAKRGAEAYIRELKAQLLERIARGKVVSVPSPMVKVGDEMVQPISSVEVRHKSRSSLKYDEKRIIRVLTAEKLAPAYVEEEIITRDVLDRRAFEKDLYEMGGLAPLRRFVEQSESDWIEVRGLPK